jgi:hypothetical protein
MPLIAQSPRPGYPVFCFITASNAEPWIGSCWVARSMIADVVSDDHPLVIPIFGKLSEQRFDSTGFS